ncbi:MAG TPA: mycofactocin precursor MftA [Streptosporangiaceae bacterium]|jgi:mycofactocin precursor|nr:mycofactocin precursor MftA [Streptosporangiaceae bacterium]
MSGQIATVEAAAETSPQSTKQPDSQSGTEPSAAAAAEQPEVTIQDVLVEDVSIDGMCGVY